ncbi:MAG TPA: 50S ribosomal protein L3 [Candidatus Saccharimonadales bacterium]|nr:50S ribosomal protein L3 [Candidatus Saccharimonadales bacterium]
MKVLITRKVGMTSTISENGVMSPITLLSVHDNVVTQVKTVDNDGYSAVQLGSETKKKLNKPQVNHFKTSKVTPKIVKEFRVNDDEVLAVGDTISFDNFEVGDVVDVTGTSKGKGFAGTIKRHNFHRGRKTHGGRSYRRIGSIGSMFPQKVFKGKKMAGRMGHDQVTIKNLKVSIIDKDLGVIGISGAVPGPKKSVVIIKGVK